MSSRTLLALTALAFAPAALAADGNFDRTVTFSGAPVVSVSTGSGYVHVYPGVDGQVHVIGHVHANAGWFSSGSVDERVKQIVASPPVTQAGNIVTIGKLDGDSDLFRNISIDYDVTVPASTTLTARAGSGSLEIGGILGEVNAGTGSGSIHAENVGGNSRFEAGSGSIRANHVHGAATADSGSGHIELSVSGPGDVQAKTGSGGVEVSGVTGGLRASSGSGSIQVQGNPTADWRLESGSGSIQIQTDASAHFSLRASTGSGSVKVDRPFLMEGAMDRHHVSGTVNGGGPTVRASTGSGSITVR